MMVENMKEAFEKVFGEGKETKMFFSPGRVNLIGEHIDYNGGCVFPCAITYGTYAVVSEREDKKVRLYSGNFEERGMIEFELTNLAHTEDENWSAYVKGVMVQFLEAGYEIANGFDAYVFGTIPNGSGLSSSASLELLVSQILKELNGYDITMVDMVKLSQKAENEYVGVNCGIMDQFAIGMGKKDSAIKLNTNDLSYEYAEANLGNHSILIMNTNKKVVLVGTGFVGMSMAYAMLNQGGVDELVLIDVLKDKAKGEEMDLSHGLPYAPQKMTIKAGDYSECKDANVVVITAGLPQKPGQSRLELAVANTKIVKEITEQVMASGFNGVFIIASNPVDLMSYVVSKVSGLPTSKVIGSGTVLDTARLRYLIAEYLDVSSKNVHAYILGEHGDSSFVPWEHCYVGCKKMVDIMEDNNYPMEDLKKIHDGVWKAAYEIIDKKRATYYGIGMALNRLVKAVLNDENAILTVSTYQNGEYEQEGLYIGVPAIINKNGVKEILKLKLSEEDQAKFDHSCDIMKENIKNEIDPMLKQ